MPFISVFVLELSFDELYIPTELEHPAYFVGSSPFPLLVALTSRWQCLIGGLASAAFPLFPIIAIASPVFTFCPTDTKFFSLWQK